MHPGKLPRPGSFDTLERQAAFSMNRSVVTALQKLPPGTGVKQDTLAAGLAGYTNFLLELYADIYHAPQAYFIVHPLTQFADRSKFRLALNVFMSPFYALIGLFILGEADANHEVIVVRQSDFNNWCALNCKPYKAVQVSAFLNGIKRVGMEVESDEGFLLVRYPKQPKMLWALGAIAQIKSDRYRINDLLRGNFSVDSAPAVCYLADEAFDTLDDEPREMMKYLCEFMESQGLEYSCTRGGLPENGWYNAVYKKKRPSKTILGFNVLNAELQAIRVVGHNPDIVLQYVHSLPYRQKERILQGCRCNGCKACEKGMLPEDKKALSFQWEGGTDILCGNAFYFGNPSEQDMEIIVGLAKATLDSFR